MEFMIALGLALGLLTVVAGIAVERRSSGLEARLSRYARPNATLEEMELREPLTRRVILPALQRLVANLMRMTPNAQVTHTRQNLVRAGMLSSMNVAQFEMRRLLAALGVASALAFLGGTLHAPVTTIYALALPLAALGYMLPSFWLGGRIRARQAAILKALPDTLDLLTVCVEAGLGFDAALARVVQKWRNPLTEEMERLLADLRMGRVRREALKDMAERTDVADVHSFVSSLIQADLLGVGLVKVMRVQSDQMRQRRRLRAEEQAQKAPVKMLFPLIFLIFPAVYIVILGPAMLSLSKAFGGGG